MTDDIGHRFVGVIQARMNSQRLPGKVLLPLAGAPLLQQLITRVRKATLLDALVVATTDSAADDPVAKLCKTLGTRCYRGSEPDVLGRMMTAAEAERATTMVRLTADNPFVSADLIDMTIQAYLDGQPAIDYAHTVDGTGNPYGLFVEVAAMEALREALQSPLVDDREHVTWYIRQRPERFGHRPVCIAANFPEVRFTVDTPDEYRHAQNLYAMLQGIRSHFALADLVTAAWKLQDMTE